MSDRIQTAAKAMHDLDRENGWAADYEDIARAALEAGDADLLAEIDQRIAVEEAKEWNMFGALLKIGRIQSLRSIRAFITGEV